MANSIHIEKLFHIRRSLSPDITQLKNLHLIADYLNFFH